MCDLLALLGENPAGLEKQQLRAGCSRLLDTLPSRMQQQARTPPAWYRPSFEEAEQAQQGQRRAVGADDEGAGNAGGAAEAAKLRGNEAFRRGDYPLAARLYSMAIRLDRDNATMYSNRSACHAKLGQWEEALYVSSRSGGGRVAPTRHATDAPSAPRPQDANVCVRLQPEWGKGHCRVAAAQAGQGRGPAARAWPGAWASLGAVDAQVCTETR